ncbi:MAG: hypothetical protein WCK49_08910 [Myxococcaceae bacterium]
MKNKNLTISIFLACLMLSGAKCSENGDGVASILQEKPEIVTNPTPEDPSTEVEGKTLFCEAAFQPGGPGTDVAYAHLAPTAKDAKSLMLEVEHQGYSFYVCWDFSLTTLYMTIKKGSEALAFSTARIPDNGHNDSMLQVGSSPRVWLSCDFVEYRPKH